MNVGGGNGPQSRPASGNECKRGSSLLAHDPNSVGGGLASSSLCGYPPSWPDPSSILSSVKSRGGDRINPAKQPLAAHVQTSQESRKPSGLLSSAASSSTSAPITAADVTVAATAGQSAAGAPSYVQQLPAVSAFIPAGNNLLQTIGSGVVGAFSLFALMSLVLHEAFCKRWISD